MNTRNLRLLAVSAAFLLLGLALLSGLTGCTSAPSRLAPAKLFPTQTEALTSAFARAGFTPGSLVFRFRADTGSMASTYGTLNGYAVAEPVRVRALRIGDPVLRMDNMTFHLVNRIEGPLVYTRGSSNGREDPTAVSGTVYRVLFVAQYSR